MKILVEGAGFAPAAHSQYYHSVALIIGLFPPEKELIFTDQFRKMKYI